MLEARDSGRFHTFSLNPFLFCHSIFSRHYFYKRPYRSYFFLRELSFISSTFHSLFRYKFILSLPLALLLLYGSEYNGNHTFALKTSQIFGLSVSFVSRETNHKPKSFESKTLDRIHSVPNRPVRPPSGEDGTDYGS